jgi:hypothetical protein
MNIVCEIFFMRPPSSKHVDESLAQRKTEDNFSLPDGEEVFRATGMLLLLAMGYGQPAVPGT